MFQITLTTTWKEVKKVIKEDPRCIKFSSSDRVRQLTPLIVLLVLNNNFECLLFYYICLLLLSTVNLTVYIQPAFLFIYFLVCLCRRDSESLKITSKTSISQPKLTSGRCWRRQSSSHTGLCLFLLACVQCARTAWKVQTTFLCYMLYVFSVSSTELLPILLSFLVFRSRKLIQESEQHLKDVEKILQNDKRYLVLECVPEERRKLIMFYIDDLDRRGPPPPPTASEPTRRSTKWGITSAWPVAPPFPALPLARAWPHLNIPLNHTLGADGRLCSVIAVGRVE